MPKRKRTYKKAPKRTFKRRKPYRRTRYGRRMRKYRFPTNPSGTHLNRPVRMRYATQISLTSSTGSLATWVFSANSVYDPDVSGTGHQPMGFDQMAALYNRYMVLGSRIRASFVDNATTHDSPMRVGAYLTDSSTIPYTSSIDFVEAKRGSYRMITGGSKKAYYVRAKYSPRKFWGIKDVLDNRLKIGSGVVGSPEEQAYYCLYAQTCDGTTNEITVTVLIDYFVQFTEARDIPKS